MTQDELWQQKYEKVVTFIKSHERNPSKHRLEEHQKLNFLKHNKKILKTGVMKLERQEPLKELLERYKRKNQYESVGGLELAFF